MKWIVILLALCALAYAAIAMLVREQPAPVVEIPDDATSVLGISAFQPPSGWQWQRAAIEGAGEVRWGHATPENPKGLVVFLPGYSAPLNIYFESLSRMMSAGYAVGGLDWPNQGGSSRPLDNPNKMYAKSFDGHVAAGLAVQRALFEQYPGVPVFLVGLSMGAQLGTRMLSDTDSEGVAAAALITPAYGIYGGRPSGVDKAMLATASAFGFGERYSPGTTDWSYDMQVHNLEASTCSHPNNRTRLWQSWMVEDESLRVGGMTVDYVRAFVRSAEAARSDAVLSRIQIPVWMPIAEADVFVDNAQALSACDRLSDCRGQTYAQAKHCLFEESDDYYEPFLTDLIDFLDEHAPATP